MNPIDILVLAIITGLMLGIGSYLLIRRRKNKEQGKCGSRCCECPFSDNCAADQFCSEDKGNREEKS